MKPPADASGVELPSYDPWDGDPSEYEAVASALVTREGHATEVRIGVSGLLNDPALTRWMGRSADAFRETLGPLPGLLNQLGHAYFEAAAALRAYAGKLRDGQASFAKLQASLQSEVTTNPANAGGRSGAASALAMRANQASGEHDQAKRACAKQVSAADQDVRRVRAALTDKRFSDFTTTFVHNGGNPADLLSLQDMGGDLYLAEVGSIKATLNDQPGGLPPEVLRAQIQDFVNEFGDVPQAWGGFGPLLGKVPGYLTKNDKLPDGSLPPEDQALLAMLGQAAAKAAAAGNLDSLVSTTNGTDLLGLVHIVGAAGGGKVFGSGTGAQFLSDLLTKLSNDASGQMDAGTIHVYDSAMSQALQAATQNGDAARLAMSGAGGQQLISQLLEGSVPLSGVIGTLGGSYTNDIPVRFTDSASIAAFLHSGLMTSRGMDPVAMQQVQAAMNVIRAAAAFSAWNPGDQNSSYQIGKLPPSILLELNNYAANNTLDLAFSEGSAIDGISPIWKGPGTPFYHFVVQDGEEKAFLKLALSGPPPRDVAAYRGYLEGKYSEVVQAAIHGGPESDWTGTYASLLASTQNIIDGQHLDQAQIVDARNASHLVLFNMITGALGNAPTDGILAGASQAGIGFLAPLGGTLPHDGSYFDHVFDTSHVNSVQAANDSDDKLQLNHMQALVTQGALNSGLLKPDMLDPGVVVNGRVVEGIDFDTWYKSRGRLLTLGPPPPPGVDPKDYKIPSLNDYVNEILLPLEISK